VVSPEMAIFHISSISLEATTRLTIPPTSKETFNYHPPPISTAPDPYPVRRTGMASYPIGGRPVGNSFPLYGSFCRVAPM
jgi:hypothetical protein